MATAVTGVTAVSAVAAYLAGAPRPVQAERDDCPGKVVCPLTGELVCADECPVRVGEAPAPTAPTASAVTDLPPCCAGSK